MRRIAALLASLALVFSLAPVTLAAPSDASWIVTLRPTADPHESARALLRANGGELRFVYEHAINGFSFRGPASAASALARNPLVVGIEPNADVHLDTTQTGATWGLDRIDQRTLPLSGTYSYERTGAGVKAYVIDSGIRFSHADFGGRASFGADFVGGDGSDCNGHGTHVAGTIGGSTWGVAKEVSLVAVRVFGCGTSSSWDVILAGINWAIADHQPGEPAVANLSLGGPVTSSVDTAVNNLINDGVATAVAAGNGDFLGRQVDACNQSPARVPNAMTISATTSSDAKISWANYGACVDWFAPGVSITSASNASDTGSSVKSGTSMAAPHTAGVAALYLEANPSSTPIAVRDAIYAATTKGVVTSSSTANNHLLYSGFIGGGDPEPPANTPPTAVDDSASTTQDTPVTVNVLANDTDADGDALDVVSAEPSSLGSSVAVNADGSVTYTPAAGFFGIDRFTYVISDGTDTDTGLVRVEVAEAPPPPPSDITLDVTATKVRGTKSAALSWSGAAGAMVDVVRNGTVVAATDNDGAYSETLGKGGGTYVYQVCETGTSSCSNEVTVSY